MTPIRFQGGVLSPRKALYLSLASLLVLTAGCGGTSGSGGGDSKGWPMTDLWPSEEGGGLSSTREGCDVLNDPAVPGGSFTFALTDSVNPGRAPIPHNTSERIVFAQLYETLIKVDCAGEMHPGLAEKWTCTEDSTVWVFTLREGARFWDGTRITSEDVRRSWAENQDCPAVAGNTSPWTWLNARAETVTSLDARRLAVRLPEPHARFPMLMAHPATAVAVRRPGWTWPVGSGPVRLRASDPAPLPDLACRPNLNHPDAPIWKNLTFRIIPGVDPRDLVATDLDLTLSRNLDVVRFFEDAPGFHPVPLPWNRLYLLVCPPEMNPTGSDRWLTAAGKLDAARDVTTVSARTWPDIIFPAGGGGGCPQLSGPVTGSVSARLDWDLAGKNLGPEVIAYPADDPGAKDMAHRLGALMGREVRTAALPDGSTDFALEWQMSGAFILPVDQQYATGCLQMAVLLGKAAWLQKAALDLPGGSVESLAGADATAGRHQLTPAESLAEKDLVLPLGLSRSWLVARGSLAGIILAFDGTPLLAGLGTSVDPGPFEATP